MKSALLLVDIQNDFLPGGALAVPEGDAVVPIANRLQWLFNTVVASQDWHPPGHLSFASSHAGLKPFDTTTVAGLEQILWPDHCVQDTPGAEFAPDLNTEGLDAVFRKGEDPRYDSYSAFFDNGHQRSSGLADWLHARSISRVYIVGLAADVCVLFTALDAVNEGFDTVVVSDATRGVDLQPGDTKLAFDRMRQQGVSLLTSRAILN
jgi:nicotinamidase/pyrazinamidase